MLTIDANGSKLTPQIFILAFHQAQTLAPPRFLTLRLHPKRFGDLETASKIPEVIQLGNTPGPIGRLILRVNCIKPPFGLGDGVQIVQDDEADETKLQFLVQNAVELEVKNLA